MAGHLPSGNRADNGEIPTRQGISTLKAAKSNSLRSIGGDAKKQSGPRVSEICQEKTTTPRIYDGSAYGSRTRVPALRGLCPNH